MFNYAKIDDAGVAYAIVQNTHALGGDATLVPIPKYDSLFVGQRYAAGTWTARRRFALIDSGSVVDVVSAFDPPAGAIEAPQDVSPGWTYVDGVFVAPAPPVAPEPPAPTPPTTLTPLEFMSRFTDAELAGIYSAAKVSVEVEVWLAKFNRTDEVVKTDPRTIGGLQAMELAGLLAAGRAAEILA